VALESELLALLTETVTLENWTGQSTTGVPTYDTPQSYPARIELKSLMVRLRDGREAVARGVVYVGLTNVANVPSVAARLTLPAAYIPNQPPILDVQTEQDDLNLHHVKLMIG
jgi:hypothetical protein